MNLSPKQIVKELDQYIIGQDDAKKAVAIALRNRYRRSKLPAEIREEITPKNIILKGATGIGKTEIARRLARLVKAPYIKVEATKFTEVGYVGRDCESMIRDLVEMSVKMVKDEKIAEVEAKAKDIVNKKLFDHIYPIKKNPEEIVDIERARIMDELVKGKYDNETIEIDAPVQSKPIGMIAGMGAEINIQEIFDGFMPTKTKKRKTTIAEARNILIANESDKLIDLDNVSIEAIKRAEQEGIIFIDEIDKIAGKGNSRSGGPDVSREGVQRDILPFVEGCSVMTKYGMIKTDFILFIGAGAFHISNIEDLIPELQGRFPIRVELKNLTKTDFYKILTEPKNALILQYKSLLSVDNIDLHFEDEAIKTMAEIAERENEQGENIGARRLQAIMEKLLEDISFNAGEQKTMKKVVITKEYVEKVFNTTIKSYDLKKYIL